MGTRTVRLDAESEKALRTIVRATGLPMSAALKRGLLVLRDQIVEEESLSPFDVYRQLDLGPGGYATHRSDRTRRGVREALRRKLGR